MRKLNFLFLGVLLSGLMPALAQQPKTFIESLSSKNHWVDSTYRKLNGKERIAQLFMVRAHTDKGKAYEDSVATIISRDKVGGLVFFQGGPVREERLIRQYQEISKVPLLIAMDAEWGLGMRLDSTISYPYQMALGAIHDDELIYKMGQEIARDLRRLGVHVNFAPDADINNNPQNPVINYRSFGDNKYKVAAKAGAYMEGLQDSKVIVSVKHFPGHGDTDVDSHYDLPQLTFGKERLDSLELYPFRALISQGASGVMVAHMNIPALDPTPNLPSTLSRPIVTDLLKGELGFKGLVFSDAMEMKGVVKYFPDGEADVRAIIAGNDVVELSQNTERAIRMVKKAVRSGRISRKQIKASVKEVLAAKYWVGLDKSQTQDQSNVATFLNRPEARNLNQQLADAAVTLLKSDSLLGALDFQKRTAIVSVGVSAISLFQDELKQKFSNSLNFVLSKNAVPADIERMMNELKTYDQVILAIYDTRLRPASTLDYNASLKLFITEMAKLNTITVLFANPYTLAGLPGIEESKSILVNYQNSPEAQRASARVISRQLKTNGKLPVSINVFFKNGDGIESSPVAAETNFK